jgi:hypothetical protein
MSYSKQGSNLVSMKSVHFWGTRKKLGYPVMQLAVHAAIFFLSSINALSWLPKMMYPWVEILQTLLFVYTILER